MNQKRYNQKMRRRRKRIIIAYAVRTLCALVLLTMVILMGCGCLYIYEHFIQDDPVEAQADDTPQADKDKEDENGDVKEPELDIPVADYELSDASGLFIVLDAGHGGNDGGTTNTDGDVLEKDINLSVALKVQALLEEQGAQVVMTRDTDETLELAERTYIANQHTSDLFVSLHCNSYEEDPSISGIECYYHRNSDVSKGYAESLIAKAEELGDLKVRSALAQNYQVLRDSARPAILIEMGYMTNETEVQYLANNKYQDLLAHTITECIIQTLKADDTTTS